MVLLQQTVDVLTAAACFQQCSLADGWRRLLAAESPATLETAEACQAG
jgi:hypothetical protein